MTPKALVIGGSGGIGKATVDLFTERGWQVINADLVPAVDPNSVPYFPIDVTNTESIQTAIESASQKLHGLDSVVNCAGIIDPKPSIDVSDESWERMISVHLHGSFKIARESYKYLAASQRASLVMVSSIAAHVGMPRRASYSAAKGGIEALTRSLAVEWASAGIRVNSLAPGYTKTLLVAAAFADGRADENAIRSQIPLGRLAETIEMAKVIYFLSSNESSFLTGETILNDGGMSINAQW